MPQDAIQILEKDHRRVKSLLSKLERSDGAGRRSEILAELSRAIREHTTIEEEIFYPAFHEAVRGTKQEKLFYEAAAEHHVVDLVLPEIEAEDRDSMAFAAKAKVLADLLGHHIDEEEGELFRAMRQAVSAAELARLGEALLSRKKELAAEEAPPPRAKARKARAQAASASARAQRARPAPQRARRAPKPTAKAKGGRRGKLDLNAAGVEDLKSIEGISERRAQSLVEYRDSHGPFHDWDELLEVKGISSGLLARMKREARLGQ